MSAETATFACIYEDKILCASRMLEDYKEPVLVFAEFDIAFKIVYQ